MSIKVSISSYVAGQYPESAVKRLVKSGFEYAELGSNHSAILLERTPEEWVKFREFAEGMGLKFRQGHLPLHIYITEKDEELRKANVEVHRRYCRMYHALGITAPVLHCGGYDALLKGDPEAVRAVRAIRVKSLKELLSDLPEGMSICLENLPYETFEDVFANLEDMGCPHNLGLCLDTGHLHFSPKPNHEEFILKAGKYLKALHMHDNVGPMAPGGVLDIPGWLGSDKHMFPSFFSGGINWNKVTKALRTIGYDGLWNLEVSSDLGENALHQTYRDMILKQDRERAEMIFNYDADAPAPDDPVNDYSAIKAVESAGVKAEVERYSFKVTTPKYTLNVEPVHGARISRWQTFGMELLKPSAALGWGVVGSFQPAAAAFNLHSGMKIDGVKAVDQGIEILMSKVLTEDDNAIMEGVTVQVQDFYGAESFSRKVRFINSTARAIPAFAFRFHCMPELLNPVMFPDGNIRMDDGVSFERCNKTFRIRLGEPDAMVEKAMESYAVVDSKGTKVTLSASGCEGKIELSYPGVLPAAVFCWESYNATGTLESIFRSVSLKVGESCEFDYAVKLI